MPVPTDTFRNFKILNLIFAASGVLMLLSTFWLIHADYSRQWRKYQLESLVWETAITKDAQEQAADAQTQHQLEQLSHQVAERESRLPADKIARLEERIAETTAKRDAKVLPTAKARGELTPQQQLVEKALLTYGEYSEQVRQERRVFAQLNDDYLTKAGEIASLEAQLERDSAELTALRAEMMEKRREIDDLQRHAIQLAEKLQKVNPTGLAWVGQQLRNAPLLDWFNPSLKVEQVVLPGVRTDLNFLTVDAIDRCHTCHVNIANPFYEEASLLAFAERQLARYEGQHVDSLSSAPVVLLDFWENASGQVKGDHRLRAAMDQAKAQARDRINQLRQQDGQNPLAENADLMAELRHIAVSPGESEAVSLAQWYRSLSDYREDLQTALRQSIGKDAFKQLRSLYRHRLIEQFNRYRAEDGLKPLSANLVMLGHPDPQLYAEPESNHPMKDVGCTVCHEGSGEETQFEHTAHTPRDIWVDVISGNPVPSFLTTDHGHLADLKRQLRRNTKSVAAARWSVDGASTALASEGSGDTQANAGQAHGPVDGASGDHDTHHRYVQHDLNLNDPHDVGALSPVHHDRGNAALYDDPVDGTLRLAVRQADYWRSHYGWHQVQYMYWEKPMHALQYIESSCTKCHTEGYDVKDAAPRLFEGRQLFAKLGCVNCHAVESLEDDLDIKRVGPSLVHVKDKLSNQMIASWIWSPRAFRPTTRMPHYFMLENNSSPADILRTRVEVAAMAYHLQHAEPKSDYYEQEGLPFPSYQPEVPPEESGNVINGRVLFNQVGCLGCHTNLAEDGQRWITEDLVTRRNISKQEAANRYAAMTYNQQHQYALLHLSDRLELTGPEISGVATKLKAGRSAEDARNWLYDWLRNPRHYSSYTIMPSFRLSEQEANDLAAYLLTLERPGYTPDPFDLDEAKKQMLAELVATLKAPQSTIKIAREQVRGTATEDQLRFLGEKMISHYGCNGCHLINGFEQASSACTNLDDWGLKDPHKIDFAYYGHAFERQRRQAFPITRVKHEGLEASAPQITHESDQFEHDEFAWEHISDDRRSWLYYKLHNPRTYDRGKFPVFQETDAAGDNAIDIPLAIEQGRPYDKLKMPKFFLTDGQVQSLVTFVTSIRKPLVDPALQEVVSDAGARTIRGRQVAALYNCYGCHNIEGDRPHIRDFFDMNPDGSFNELGYKWAPPRLIGEGAKVQHDWLFNFLRDVHKIRPWLVVRMPSFPMTEDQAAALVGYFAGHSQRLAEDLYEWTAEVKVFVELAPPETAWYEAESLAEPLGKIKQFALAADLIKAKDLDPRLKTPKQLAKNWNKLRDKIYVLATAYQTNYPFVPTPRPTMLPADFRRGEEFVNTLGCLAGQCHTQGDEQLVERLLALDAAPAAGEEEEDPYGSDDGYEDDGYDDEEDGYEDVYAEEEEGYGEEDGYGDDEDQGGDVAVREEAKYATAPAGDPQQLSKTPNLNLVGERIQRSWLNEWVQHPETILPGTWMLPFFPDGKSQFAGIQDASQRSVEESKFGYTAQQQREILMDYLYAASSRNHTHRSMRPERLAGQPDPEIDIPPLPRPIEVKEAQAAATDEMVVTPAAAATVEKIPVQLPEATAAPLTSNITLHGTDSAFAGNGTGRVVGVATFVGQPPRRRPLGIDADSFCNAHWSQRGTKPMSESVVINANGTIQNVFVHVIAGLPAGRTWPVSPEAPLLDQVGCRYTPHVLGIVAGQTLTVRNSDSTLHNVKMSSEENDLLNQGQPVRGMQSQILFEEPEMGVTFKCDVHPWMGAWLNVMEHPFFAVSDVQGRFEIMGLPPGTYTLEAWHESKQIAPVQFEVEVKADTSHRKDVTLN